MLTFHDHLETQLALLHELDQLAHSKRDEQKTSKTAEKKDETKKQ